MAYDEELAQRIRSALAGAGDVREVRMFGGLSFMVNDKLAVAANNQGTLMVHCDPGRVDELLGRAGAGWAEMRGRQMGKGWLVVGPEGYANDDDFAFWITEAVEFSKS